MLKLLLSFLRFVASEAPTIAPEVARLVALWANKNGIPEQELLPALEVGETDEKVAAADREVNQLIADLWPKG
jgi:hypothetical protein